MLISEITLINMKQSKTILIFFIP